MKRLLPIYRSPIAWLACLLCCTRLTAQNHASKREVYTETVIRSTPDRIWNLLADFPAYPDWHPYLIAVKGGGKVGDKMKFSYLKADSSQGHFSAFMLEAAPGRSLAWGGSLGFVFRARHYFTLEVVDDSTTRLVQGEYWKGLFGPLYGRKIYRETYQNFLRMNAVLKAKLEEA